MRLRGRRGAGRGAGQRSREVATVGRGPGMKGPGPKVGARGTDAREPGAEGVGATGPGAEGTGATEPGAE